VTSVRQTDDNAQGDADEAAGTGGLPLVTEDARRVLDGTSAGTTSTPSRGRPAPPGGAGAKTGSAAPTEEARSTPGGAEGGPGEVPSRYYANNFSQQEQSPRSDAESVRENRRGERYLSRRVLRGITSLERVRKCGRVGHDTQGAGVVENAGIAHWSGLCTCGSIWACPVCSAKVRATRADEIARAVATHVLDGGNAWMITLTARHKRHHALADVFDAVAKGWPKLMGGAAWAGGKPTGRMKTRRVGEKEALGVVGWIRSMEVTYGERNGWHPHLHVVLLTRDETAPDLMKAMGRWDRTWRKWMAKHGFEPTTEHGVVWKQVKAGKEAGEYIAKVQEGKGHLGNEMARGDLKKGRFKTLAPFELLTYFRITGDAAVIPIWREYEKGTFRRRAITWAKGLRDMLLEDEPEKSDE